jgi:hypothetical protein
MARIFKERPNIICQNYQKQLLIQNSLKILLCIKNNLEFKMNNNFDDLFMAII